MNEHTIGDRRPDQLNVREVTLTVQIVFNFSIRTIVLNIVVSTLHALLDVAVLSAHLPKVGQVEAENDRVGGQLRQQPSGNVKY